MEQKTVSWEEFAAIQKERDKLRAENAQLKDKMMDEKPTPRNRHSGAFWRQIDLKLLKDPDYIKRLVRNKTLTMFDTDAEGMNLLITAAYNGSYEIVQFCLNQGADINSKCQVGKTALDYARNSGFFHIEQLLLFATMNVNIGNEIKNISTTMHKQNGINQNILNVLLQIGHQSKQLFEKMLIELMINMINQRLSFDDVLLNLCYDIEAQEKDPLASELWKALASTCSDIIKNGSKRDWHWLKTYVLPSTLWYRKETKSGNYLYYKLLELVNEEAVSQVKELEKDLNTLANDHKDEWDKLTVWDITDQYAVVRQDVIPNGIVSRYTYKQLSESSGATFNSPRFYDYNQYLSQLILLSQIVDDQFQASIQLMFDIDKVTNIGDLSTDDMDMKQNMIRGDGQILYQRGPVKLIERARNKAQTDYVNEAYPASACVVDLNRCALIFNDISTMLTTLQLFVNKVKYYQSGNIIGIVRDKNGFIDYLKEPQYADIKLNVLIKGKHNNIIGEVQFLLNRMKSFKDKAHNLYGIQRLQESIESSVAKILPLLLNEDKHLFIAGNRGNVREICDVMVTFNKSGKELMKTDEKHNTILHSFCTLGHVKAFDFLRSLLHNDDFVKYALSLNAEGITPLDRCLRGEHVHIARRLFGIKEIQEFILKSADERYRLCIDLFGYNTDSNLTDYLLNLLKISHDDVRQLIYHSYSAKSGGDIFAEVPIISRVVIRSTAKELKTLVSVIGEKAFLDGVLMTDVWGDNALQNAIYMNKIDHMQFMLETDIIRNKCMQDMNLLYSVCKQLTEKFNESMAKYVITKLVLTQAKLTEMQENYALNIQKILSVMNK